MLQKSNENNVHFTAAMMKKAKGRMISTAHIPSLTIETGLGKELVDWLCAACGAVMTLSQGKQIANRAIKFLKFCTEDDSEELKNDFVDYCIGSPCLISKCIEHIGHEWEIGNSAQIHYLQSISELMDFMKARGVSWETLRTFSSAEVYIKRGKRTLTKRKILDWSQYLDIDTLNERNCWATLSELSKVVPFHSKIGTMTS